MTDNEKVYHILKDGKPHHVAEICQRCYPGSVCFPARSRISNLREKGFDIKTTRDENDVAIYQLVGFPEVNPYEKKEVFPTDRNGQEFFELNDRKGF